MIASMQLQQDAHQQEQCGQQGKGPAPTQGVGDQPPDELTAEEAHRGAQSHPGQGFLALGIGHSVPGPGQCQRDDGSGAGRGQDAGGHQQVQRGGQAGQHVARGRPEQGVGNHAQLAIAVAQ